MSLTVGFQRTVFSEHYSVEQVRQLLFLSSFCSLIIVQLTISLQVGKNHCFMHAPS